MRDGGASSHSPLFGVHKVRGDRNQETHPAQSRLLKETGSMPVPSTTDANAAPSVALSAPAIFVCDEGRVTTHFARRLTSEIDDKRTRSGTVGQVRF